MRIFDSIEEVKKIGQINANTLLKSECLEAMSYIPSNSVDMVLCDLPYG